jgi:branched-chain amino acid transport system ATP-binding protein
MPLLDIRDVFAGYGDGAVVHGLSLSLEEGEITALIGANGAGKTTLMRVISGLLQPSAGEIWYADKRIDGMKPENIVAAGVAHVPEGRRLFPRMSVYENLLVGASSREADRKSAENIDLVFSLFPKVKERRGQMAGTLSGGEQQMVAIGRALMAAPKLLLLDETSLGLAPVIVEGIFRNIEDLKKHGMTILVVEQNTALALQVASYAYVLEHGSIALHGEAGSIAKDDRVRRAYLGI